MSDRRGKRPTTLLGLLAALSCLVVLLTHGSANAVGFSVTNRLDSGPGSLRQAILDANANLGPDAITFAPGTNGRIDLSSGPLKISGDTEIVGPDANLLRISGTHANRVLEVAPGATVRISGLTISEGRVVGGDATGGSATGGAGETGDLAFSPGETAGPGSEGGEATGGSATGGGSQGAGIFNEGILTLERVAVSSNVAAGGNAGDVEATGGAGGHGGSATAAGANGGTGGAGGNAEAGAAEAGDVVGAGIFNSGSLTLLASTVSGNVASGGNGGSAKATSGNGGGGGNGEAAAADGGTGGRGGDAFAPGGSGGDALGAGIYNTGTLIVSNSTVSNNVAQSGAPGIATEITGSVGLNGSGSSGGAGGAGGAPGTATAIAGTGGAGIGGGIFNAGGSATITNSTLAGNRAADGANVSAPSLVNLRSTIASDPGGGGASCSGQVDSFGFNLESGASCGLDQPTDLPNVNPELGPLTDNGGSTETHLPAVLSPAIDRGAGGPPLDQRGLPRTLDSPGLANALTGDGTDIGAVELPALPQQQVPTPAEGPPPPKCLGRTATITGTNGADRLKGTAKADVIAGLGRKDKIAGLKGNDRICGDGDRDEITGGPGNDQLAGEGGPDRLGGGPGKDQLLGGRGVDALNGGAGKDVLKGGAGKDTQKQ